MELVKDRETREPFHELGLKVTNRCGNSVSDEHPAGADTGVRLAHRARSRSRPTKIDRALAIIDQALVIAWRRLRQRSDATFPAVTQIGRRDR